MNFKEKSQGRLSTELDVCEAVLEEITELTGCERALGRRDVLGHGLDDFEHLDAVTLGLVGSWMMSAAERARRRLSFATTFLLTVMEVVRASSSTIALDVLYVARSGVFAAPAIELNVATRSSEAGQGLRGPLRAVARRSWGPQRGQIRRVRNHGIQRQSWCRG